MSNRVVILCVMTLAASTGCDKSGASQVDRAPSKPVIEAPSTPEQPVEPASSAPVSEPEQKAGPELPEEVGFAHEMERAARQVEELDALCAEQRATSSCDPVMWLSHCSRRQINTHYCTQCDQDELCQVEYGPGLPATVLFVDPLRSAPPCEEVGWLLSTLEHLSGAKLSDKSFAPLMVKAHRPMKIGEPGKHLIALLAREHEACTSAKTSPSPRQRERALAWLKDAQRGSTSTKSIALLDGEKVNASEFVERIQPLLEGVVVDRRTPMVVLDADEVEVDGAPKYTVALQMKPSFRGFLSCVVDNPDACHTFEYITLFFDDRDRIIAYDLMEQG